jgi:hypothetical protein
MQQEEGSDCGAYVGVGGSAVVIQVGGLGA